MTFRPYLPLRGILGGALAGFGILVLLQQYAIIIPTRSALIVGVVGGAVVMLLMSNLVRAASSRTAPAQTQTQTQTQTPTPVVAAAAAQPTASGFAPTHRAPAAGLDAYEQPGAPATVARLDPGLEVEVLEHAGDWTHVRCSNGWETWVDGRLLVGR